MGESSCSDDASQWQHSLLKRPAVPLRNVFCLLSGSGGEEVKCVLCVHYTCLVTKQDSSGWTWQALGSVHPVRSELQPTRAKHC